VGGVGKCWPDRQQQRGVLTQSVHPANPSTIQSCDSPKLGIEVRLCMLMHVQPALLVDDAGGSCGRYFTQKVACVQALPVYIYSKD
jgi:hypothetical protein